MRARVGFHGVTPPGRITEDATRAPAREGSLLLALAIAAALIYFARDDANETLEEFGYGDAE